MFVGVGVFVGVFVIVGVLLGTSVSVGVKVYNGRSVGVEVGVSVGVGVVEGVGVGVALGPAIGVGVGGFGVQFPNRKQEWDGSEARNIPPPLSPAASAMMSGLMPPKATGVQIP